MTRKINRATSVTQSVTLRGRPTRPFHNVLLLDLLTAHARFSIRKKAKSVGNGEIPLDDESLLETHASSIPPTSQNRRQKCLSGTTSHESLHAIRSSPPFIDSSSRNKQKRDFALYEVLRLLISYFSLRREISVQLLGSRRGFPAFSIVINDSRFSLSPSLRFYARPVSHTCTRHCDIRDYLGLMKVCGRYAANRALVGRPLPIETVPFCRSFKKIIPLINLSRYLHCLSSAIIERSTSLSLPSISRFFFFFFFYVGFNEANSRPSLS